MIRPGGPLSYSGEHIWGSRSYFMSKEHVNTPDIARKICTDEVYQAFKSFDLALEREQGLWEGENAPDFNTPGVGIVYATLNAVRSALQEVMEHEIEG